MQTIYIRFAVCNIRFQQTFFSLLEKHESLIRLCIKRFKSLIL